MCSFHSALPYCCQLLCQKLKKHRLKNMKATQYEASGIENTEIFRHSVSSGARFVVEALLLDDKK